MQHFKSLTIAGIMLMVSAQVFPNDLAPEIKDKYDQLIQFDRDTIHERAQAGISADTLLVEKFEELGFSQYFPPGDSLSIEELEWILRATGHVAYYNPHLNFHEKVHELFEALEARNAINLNHLRLMNRTWAMAGELENARALRDAFPDEAEDLIALPEVRDGDFVAGNGPSVLAVEDDAFAVTRKNVSLNETLSIVTLTSANCGFSQLADKDIAADPALRQLFTDHGVWLSRGPGSLLRFNEIQEWNRTHFAEILIAPSREEWPMIQHSSTPTFYISRADGTTEVLRSWNDEVKSRLTEISTEVSAAE